MKVNSFKILLFDVTFYISNVQGLVFNPLTAGAAYIQVFIFCLLI